MNALRTPPPRRNHGLALILVLWILSLLAIIANSFVFSTRANIQLTSNLVGVAQAQALADAGIHRAIHALAVPATDPNRWKGDGRAHAWEYQGETIRITIRDESGKIDINSASDELLRHLFRHAGLGDPEAVQLVDAIVDWRDEDMLRRPNGAEAPEYAAAGLMHGPANARFQLTGELRQVLGMSEALYRRVADLITVYSGQSGIDSTVAPRGVLLVLPGADPLQVDAYLAQREATPPGQTRLAFPPAQAFAGGESNVFSILAEVRLQDGSAFAREAVVRLGRDIQNPVALLAWRAPDLSPRAGDGVNQLQREADGK